MREDSATGSGLRTQPVPRSAEEPVPRGQAVLPKDNGVLWYMWKIFRMVMT